MLAPKQNLPADQRKLLRFYSSLGEQDRASLLTFAEFLSQREDAAQEPLVITEPESIPRPEEESVVAAIKRLSKTYHMLDKSELFHETSDLMTAHVMQGRAAPDVIDELEVLFKDKYQQLNESSK